MATIKGTIKVPRCWKRLIETVFEDGDEGYVVEGTNHSVTSEHNVKGNADPEPHYDDTRSVVGTLEGGGTIQLDLCSGQGNYYGGATIHDADGEMVYGDDIGDPIESLSDEEEFEGDDDNTYLITIEWEGEDPYENGYPE